MKLNGRLLSNLQAAVKTASRLHGQRVYPETLYHWEKLLDEARRALRSRIKPDDAELLRVLVSHLEEMMGGRRVVGGRPDRPTIEA